MLVGNLHPDRVGPGVLPTSQVFHNTVSKFALNNLYYCKRIGDYQCSEHYMVDRRAPEKRRRMYHVFLILSGCLQIEYRGHTFAASPGSVAVLDCRQAHRYCCTSHVNFVWLDIDGGATAAYVRQLTARSVPLFRLPNFNAAVGRILSIGREIEAQRENEHMSSSFWHELFAVLASAEEPQDTDTRSRITGIAVPYIQQHFAEKLTVEKLAGLCSVSVYHFIRLFKQTQNCTPHEYIMGVRLRRGIHLLLTTELPVSEIAEAVGFYSASHFTSCFRANYGMTPRQYRTSQPG